MDRQWLPPILWVRAVRRSGYMRPELANSTKSTGNSNWTRQMIYRWPPETCNEEWWSTIQCNYEKYPISNIHFITYSKNEHIKSYSYTKIYNFPSKTIFWACIWKIGLTRIPIRKNQNSTRSVTNKKIASVSGRVRINSITRPDAYHTLKQWFPWAPI